MIHGVIARSAAAMPPAPPVQRKAILLPVIAVRAVLRAVLPLWPVIAVLRLLMLRLSAGDERWQAVDVALAFRTRMLRPRLKLLLVLLRLIVLLIVMLLARIVWLRLARGERLAANMGLLTIAVVVAVIGRAHLSGRLLLVIGLTLPELLLRRSDDAEIMLGMLIIIFRCNRVAGALRVTSELKVLFGDVGRGSANFYVRPVGFIHPR